MSVDSRERSLVSTSRPDLYELLRQKDNPGVKLPSLTVTDKRLLVWSCPKGHRYERQTRLAVQQKGGVKCLVCVGRTVVVGVNDLPTLRPDIAAFWDRSLNSFLPEGISPGSQKRAFFRCKLGHSFSRKVAEATRRTSETLCFYCTSKKLLPGFNDVGTRVPELATWWDSDSNEKEAWEVLHTTNKDWHWRCPEGHSFIANLGKIRARKYPCLKCSKRRAAEDLDSFREDRHFADYDTNRNQLELSEYSFRSNATVWWKCNQGHEFERKILTHLGMVAARCPQCVAADASSLLEHELAHFVTTFFDGKVERNVRLLGRKELDLFLPALRIPIEFNGDYWHSSKVNPHAKVDHVAKREECEARGIRLLFVWEHDWRFHRETTRKTLRDFLLCSDLERRPTPQIFSVLTSFLDSPRSCCQREVDFSVNPYPLEDSP